jgi:glycosyltransferase involved in cell wall biosynthesis
MKNGKKPTVSLCMIVKDEEDFLSQCLQSVRDVVDEIILVDTGSSDATLEIARSFKAKVFQHEWKEDFSEARNVSLKHATSDWILYLDADEVLDQKSAQTLPEVLQRTEHFGFFFCIYNVKENGFVSGRHYTIRLFRNQEDNRFAGRIHEHILPKGTLGHHGLGIYHFGYDLEPETMKNKVKRNARLLKQALAICGENPELRYHLAGVHFMLGEYEKSMEHATLGMELTEEFKEKNCLYLSTLQVLTSVYCKMEDWDEAEACCLKALEIRDDFIDALYTLAGIYMMRNEGRKAVLTYHRFLEKKRLIDHEPRRGLFFRSLNAWGREAEVHNNLGGIFYENGNFDRAIEEASKAIALLPHEARSYCNLGSALAAKGNLEGAELSFKKALEIETSYLQAEEGLKRLKNALGT